MDIGNTVSRVRKEYKEYLRENHPDWAESAVSTRVSDAFFCIRIPFPFLSGNVLRAMSLWLLRGSCKGYV